MAKCRRSRLGKVGKRLVERMSKHESNFSTRNIRRKLYHYHPNRSAGVNFNKRFEKLDHFSNIVR